MRRRGRACTTWRCCGSSAAPRTPSETAVLAGGDDVAFNAAMAPMLMAQPGEAHALLRAPPGRGPARLHRRAGRVVRALTDPGMDAAQPVADTARSAARLAARLGLGESVCHALAHAYERWDGKGYPDGLAGDEVPMAVRVVSVARDAELWARRAGWPAAVEVLAHRRGHGYDPAVVDVLVDGGRAVARPTIGDDPCAAVLDAEPAPVATIASGRLDAALAAVADFADLKSPWLARPLDRCRRAGGRRRGRGRAARRRRRHARSGGAGARRRAGRRAERDLGPSRSAQRRPVGAGPPAPVPERAGAAPLRAARPVRRRRRPPPRARRRLRLPPRRVRRPARPRRPAPGRRRRLPRDDRGPAPPPGADPGRRRVAARRRRRRRPLRTGRGRRRAGRRRPGDAARRGRPTRPGSPTARSRCCA